MDQAHETDSCHQTSRCTHRSHPGLTEAGGEEAHSRTRRQKPDGSETRADRKGGLRSQGEGTSRERRSNRVGIDGTQTRPEGSEHASAEIHTSASTISPLLPSFSVS